MIFSLLKIRKKTGAVIAGILIGMGCLLGIAMWQDISPRQLLNLLLGSFLLVLAIMVLAILLLTVAKCIGRLVKGRGHSAADEPRDRGPS